MGLRKLFGAAVVAAMALTPALVLTLGVALATERSPEGGALGKPHGRLGGEGRRGMMRLMRLGRHLDISENQRAAFREVLQGERAEMQPIHEELRSNRAAVEELTRLGGFTENEAEVTTLIQRQGELLAELGVSAQRTRAAFFNLLTEEQVAALAELPRPGPRHGRRGFSRGN